MGIHHVDATLTQLSLIGLRFKCTKLMSISQSEWLSLADLSKKPLYTER